MKERQRLVVLWLSQAALHWAKRSSPFINGQSTTFVFSYTSLQLTLRVKKINHLSSEKVRHFGSFQVQKHDARCLEFKRIAYRWCCNNIHTHSKNLYTVINHNKTSRRTARWPLLHAAIPDNYIQISNNKHFRCRNVSEDICRKGHWSLWS